MIFETLTGEAAREVDPEKLQWPKDSIIVYARRDSDGDIIGRSAIVHFPHIEGTWVSEAERGGTLAYRLVGQIENIVRNAGKLYVWSFVDDAHPEIAGYLERMGYKLQPMKLYLKAL